MLTPIIVFDLDGTLVDTAPDLIDTLNMLLVREGLPAMPYDTARKLIGGGARAMIARGLEAEGRLAAPTDLERLVVNFLEHYSEHLADRSRPFPGLADALDALEAEGFRFAVCTNKFEHLAKRLLDALKLSGRFASICGPDTFGISKPDPEVLRKTIATAGGDPHRAVMVGDSITDILTARAAAVPVVAVDFGYTERPVCEFGPDRIISHFSQLSAAIADLSLVASR